MRDYFNVYKTLLLNITTVVYKMLVKTKQIEVVGILRLSPYFEENIENITE